MGSGKEIVLVTGSSGCLGQFIVKLLQERDEHVSEIRLFDIMPYENKLGHSEEKVMTEFVEDIRDTEKLQEALVGVDAVIHAAGFIDVRTYPDVEKLEAVNVYGTQCIIDACLKKNVSRLVLASTADIMSDGKDVIYGSESTTPIPSSFAIGKYAETKCKAEQLVLKANGQVCSDGKTVLQTVALRPGPFYGENEKYFVSYFLVNAKRSNGVHYRVKRADGRYQSVYVGNAAWAFVKAKAKLAEDESCSGEAYFITDDTALTDVHETARPYLEARGFTVSYYVIPYWLVRTILLFIYLVTKMINITITSKEFDLPNSDVLKLLCSTFFFNRSKATLLLGYQPIYTPEEAKCRSMKYYTNLIIE